MAASMLCQRCIRIDRLQEERCGNGRTRADHADRSGGVFINHAFTSTGVAADAGFGGNVRYSILLPKGTHAVYAEPQSAWGNTVGDDGSIDIELGGSPDFAKYYIPGMTPRRPEIGKECEIIVQRGTAYRVNGIFNTGEKTKEGKDIFDIMLEVVNQPNFKTGWERTG